MLLREYAESDLAKISALHCASHFEFALPDLAGKSVFSRHVVSDKSGLGMAGFLQLSAEAIFVCDPHWRTPAWRLQGLKQLHQACYADAARAGVASVNAFLAPAIVKQFGRRLSRMGWNSYRNEEWRCFSHEVKCG